MTKLKKCRKKLFVICPECGLWIDVKSVKIFERVGEFYCIVCDEIHTVEDL